MRRFLTGLAATILALTPYAATAQPSDKDAPQTNAAPPGGYTGPFFPTGEPVVTSGEIAKDQAIMTVPVRFSFTGTLENEIDGSTWIEKHAPIPAGQPMFAMLFGNRWAPSAGTTVVWCALRPNDNAKSTFKWQTVCLPKDSGGATRCVDSFFLLPFRLEWRNSTPYTNTPKIKEGPANYPFPLLFSYRLRQIDSKDMDVDMYLTVDGYDAWIAQTNPRREADGSAILPILGGAIRLVPVGKKSVRAEVIKPLSAQSPDLMLPTKW